jgi:subtilisin family serine protease
VPTNEYRDLLYPKFGVKSYHSDGHFGRGVSIYVIDIGLSNLSFKNVKSRTITNAMAPKNTHGSFVTSILASPLKDGCRGIVPEAQIYIAEAADSEGRVYASSLVKAIHDAIELNVDIISISMGTSVYDAPLEKAVSLASKQGIIVLGAAGNCGCRSYEFPSSCKDAISVGSIDLNRNLSPFNTKNDFVSVFAPGQNLSVPGSKSKLSGTSFAVPFAAGLLALEFGKRKASFKAAFKRQEAINFLRSTIGLSCDNHNYVNQVCTGELAPPPSYDALFWFLVLVTFSGIFLLGNCMPIKLKLL